MAVQLHDDYPQFTRAGNSCSACGAGQRMLFDAATRQNRPERVVDFFIHIDMEGHLMLCEQCVLEAAAALGWVSPARRDTALAVAAQLSIDLATVTAERDAAAALVRAVRMYDEMAPAAVEPTHDSLESSEPDPDPEPEPEPVRKTKPRARPVTA